jgi:hypothetical protein
MSESITTWRCGACDSTVTQPDRPLRLGPLGWFSCEYVSRRMSRTETAFGCSESHARMVGLAHGRILFTQQIKE